MASWKKCAESSDIERLPLDALTEILVRLTAKELCRLRVLSPFWRSLTSDQTFIATHEARHTEPLLAFVYRGKENADSVDMVDLSGGLVKRMPRGEGGIVVLRTRLNLLRIACRCRPRALWVLNPATGASLALPECHAEGFGNGLGGRFFDGYRRVDCYAFGQISTGEYKALRITCSGHKNKFCEVITVDADCRSHGVWREILGPPTPICAGNGLRKRYFIADEMKCVAVGRRIHFLIDFRSIHDDSGDMNAEPGSIASFDLETEQWMAILNGPPPVRAFLRDNVGKYSYKDLDMQLSLFDQNGCLVTVHNIHNTSLDLWFLSDYGNGLWVKKYSMPSQVARHLVYPLLIVNDERILLRHEMGSLHSYNLKTGTCTDIIELEIGTDTRYMGTYTGSLLSQ